MASTTELRMVLFRIRQALLAHPVFVRGTGVPVDDPARARELEDLDRLSLQLSLVLRELKSKSSMLGLREQNLWNVSHNERYRAAASVHAQQAGLNDVLDLANEVKALLEDLMRRSGLIGEGEVAQGIGELIEKLYHQAYTHGEVHNMPDGLAYSTPAPGHYAGTMEGVTILVFVALRAYIYAMKRAGKSVGMG